MADQVQGVSAPPPHPSSPCASRTTGTTTTAAATRSGCPSGTGPTAQQPGQQLVHLNWSFFKLVFSGKPDEDAEAHLLHSNDWMNAHHFIDGVKVQRFCLTLLGEARLWYQ